MQLIKFGLLAAAAQSSLAAAEIIAYWGMGGQTKADGNLGDWCDANQHIDILLLAFITKFGNGQPLDGDLGACVIRNGQGKGCEPLAKDIKKCQSQGKKIFLSLGGSDGKGHEAYKLTSSDDAKKVADQLWDSFASPQDGVLKSAPRPLGDARVDGWDIDLEHREGSGDAAGYLSDMINRLRSHFPTGKSRNAYFISGAPQCGIPDDNIGKSLKNSQYDYVNIQFYNNACSAANLVKDPRKNPASAGGVGRFNLDKWPAYLAGGKSANAKLYVGLPGNNIEAKEYHYIPPQDLPKVYDAAKSVKGFSGFMIWEVGSTKTQGVINGCNYFQHLNSVLTKGKSC